MDKFTEASVSKRSWSVPPFWCNTGVWQTDKHRATAYTALAQRRGVKHMNRHRPIGKYNAVSNIVTNQVSF